MKLSFKFLLLASMMLSFACASAQTNAPTWDKLQFLIGNWKGGEGVYWNTQLSFTFDLQHRLIVQRIHGDYPEVLGHPAHSEDTLMIIYTDQVTEKLRADLFDQFGGTLHSAVETAPDAQAVTFISEPDMLGHRFRTTYTRRTDGALSIRTLMAEPGRSDFNLMNEGVAYKNLEH